MPVDSIRQQQQRRRKPGALSSSARTGSKKSRSGSSSSADSHASSASSATAAAPKRARTRFAVPEDAQGLSKYATLTGFLRKQADNEQGLWNTYYFALRPATLLYYYNSATDDRPRGVLDLAFLQDIRWNADCLQRCVGGSAHCFRVSGHMPPDVGGSNNSGHTTTTAASTRKLRPLFLDAESASEARAWMKALETHRFDVERAEGFDAMAHRVRDTEHALQQLSDCMQRSAATAERIRRRGRTLLHSLRGLEPESEYESGSDNNNNNGPDMDVLATLEAVEALVEDLGAEAAQQAKVIATLRARELQHEQQLRDLTAQRADDLQQLPVPTQATSSISSSSVDDLGRLDRPGATKGRSASDVRDLFKLTTSFLSKKSVDTVSNHAVAATNSPTLAPCVESDDERSSSCATDTDAPTASSSNSSAMTGLVGALRKRVHRSATVVGASTVPAPVPAAVGTPTSQSRASDDTVSIATDDSESVDSTTTTSNGERLPRGWTKRASRSHPGEFFYVHVSGVTCWEIPLDVVDDDDELHNSIGTDATAATDGAVETTDSNSTVTDTPLYSVADDSAVVVAAAATPDDASASSADESNTTAAKKPSKGWRFLRKFPLAKATAAAAAATSPEPEYVAVEHPDGRHEF